jgi:hypothetical protein
VSRYANRRRRRFLRLFRRLLRLFRWCEHDHLVCGAVGGDERPHLALTQGAHVSPTNFKSGRFNLKHALHTVATNNRNHTDGAVVFVNANPQLASLHRAPVFFWHNVFDAHLHTLLQAVFSHCLAHSKDRLGLVRAGLRRSVVRPQKTRKHNNEATYCQKQRQNHKILQKYQHQDEQNLSGAEPCNVLQKKTRKEKKSSTNKSPICDQQQHKTYKPLTNYKKNKIFCSKTVEITSTVYSIPTHKTTNSETRR